MIVVAVAVLVMVCPLLGAEIQCVALLSDLEGNRERFDHFLAHHRAFYLGDDRRWHLRSDAYFVFGGDAPDRFPGERHVLRELLRLKAESPDRVILIAGNRDVNKLRLPLELSDVAMKTSPRKGKREYHVWCDEQKRVDSKATRLRWMLAKTMGSPDAFELRRNELACETAVDQCAVSDQAVVDSYLEDACPGGLFHRYLKAACLMHRQGQTLYVHAGMPQASLGHVPGERHRVARLDEWMKRLNEWYQEQLHTWETAYSSWDGSAPRPADALIAYAERWGQQPMNPFSVLYGRSTDVEGKVDLPPSAVIAWLKSAGIHRLVVGHTPSGHIPVLQRSVDGSFEMLVLDTSYGDPHKAPLVTLSGTDARFTEVEGSVELANHGLVPVRFQTAIGNPQPLGTRLDNGGILIAPHASGWISYRLGPGYQVHYEHHAELR